MTCRHHCSVQLWNCESLKLDSEGRIVEVVLGTEFSDFDRRTGDNKTRPKTGAGSSHGKSAQAPIRFVILHSVYDTLGQIATASEQTASCSIKNRIKHDSDLSSEVRNPFCHKCVYAIAHTHAYPTGNVSLRSMLYVRKWVSVSM